MDSEVSNGSGLRNEHITDLLVFGFLQSCSNHNFYPELEVLSQELPVKICLQTELEDELQTDGNRTSNFSMGRIVADSESQEEIIQNIARHLAHVGDKMDRQVRIQPWLVHSLVERLRNSNLSEEDRRSCLETTLKEVMQACPKDLQSEKDMLVIAMLLARKVADHTPSLLRDVFRVTVNFINQNFFTYVRDLVRNGMD